MRYFFRIAKRSINAFIDLEKLNKIREPFLFKSGIILALMENNRTAVFEARTFLTFVCHKAATIWLTGKNEVSNYKLKPGPMPQVQERDNRPVLKKLISFLVAS